MKHQNLSIFIPFSGCKHRCSFCDQQQITGQQQAPSPDQVQKIIQNCVALPSHRAESAQIAFFGGSFTCLPRAQMIAYLEAALPFVEQGCFTGIRLSTRPDGIDRETLALLKHYSVTHIELGAQSMSETVLSRANRGHTPADTENAAAIIREEGFSLGLQMLLGLPGDSFETAFQSAQKLAALSPAEMRLYPVVVFPHTALYQSFLAGTFRPLCVEEALEWTVPIALFLQERGIRLLKVGLHQAPGAVAGAYHPAFGELVRTGMINHRLRAMLPPAPAAIEIPVLPQELSAALGQKRQNLFYWTRLGYRLTFRADPCAPSLLQ